MERENRRDARSAGDRFARCKAILGGLSLCSRLCLTRRAGEYVAISGPCVMKVEGFCKGQRMRISFFAPDDVAICRAEILIDAKDLERKVQQRVRTD